MADRVAGPGELTCVDENCPASGLRQPEGRPQCPDCGTELARMPAALSTTAPAGGIPPSYPSPATGGGMTTPVKVAVAVAGVVLVALVSFVARNSDVLHRLTGPEFSVGDCVTVRPALNGADMQKADCASAGSSLTDPVYQVTQVQKGKDGSCAGGGFDHVTFSNEPENTTYCLVMR